MSETQNQETKKDEGPSYWENKKAETDDFALTPGAAYAAILVKLDEPIEIESKWGKRKAFNMHYVIEGAPGRFVSVRSFLNAPKEVNGALSIHQKSTLHKHLTALDPKKFKDNSLKPDVSIMDFVGCAASVTLGERDGKDGGKFIDVTDVSPLIKGAQAPTMAQAREVMGEELPF